MDQRDTPQTLSFFDRLGQRLWHRRWVRWPAWAVAALLVLWGAAWLAVPPLVKWQAQKIATEKLGRPVRIGAVQFKPWSLELTLRDVSVGGVKPADPPQLTIRRGYVHLALESVVRLAPVLEAIEIDEPALRLRHLGSGHYDVDDIIARLTSAQPPDEKPTRFALYNIAVRGGRVTFIDDPVRRTHEVRDLRLTVPFISNLPSQREVHVTPQLAFTVDGSRFDSGAQALPFDASHRTQARLNLQHFDLGPYLVYQPANLPLHVTAGALDADLRLTFEQTPKPALKIEGTASLSGVRANDAGGQEALAFQRLTVEASDVRPLAHVVHLARVELTAPRVLASRDAQGRINWVAAASAPPAAPPAKTVAAARPSKTGGRSAGNVTASAVSAAAPADWRVAIDRVAIAQGGVQWRDAAPVPGADGKRGSASVRVSPFTLEARNVTWPMNQPATFDGRMVLADAADREDMAGMANTADVRAGRGQAAAGAAARKPAPSPAAAPAAVASAPFIAFQGQARMADAQVQAQTHIQMRGLPLRLAQPYLAAFLKPGLTGSVDADADVAWNAPEAQGPSGQDAGGGAPGITVNASRLTLSHLALLGDAKDAHAAPGRRRADDLPPGTLASMDALTLEGAKVDVPGKSVSVDAIAAQAPRVRVARGPDGRWMFEDWLVKSAANTPPSPQSAPKPDAPRASAGSPPWAVRVGHLTVADGGIGWRDQQPAPGGVNVTLGQISLDARDFDLEGRKPMPLELSARIASRGGEPGKLAWRGVVGWMPVSAQGEVDAQRLPLQAFEPYAAGLLNIDVLRADASFKGKVDYAQQSAGTHLRVAGDARIEELRTASHPGSAAANDAAPDGADAPTQAQAQAQAQTQTQTQTPLRQPSPPSAPAQATSRAALAPDDGAAFGGIGEELLSCKQLRVTGLDVQLDPGKSPQVTVGESQLSDFYARIIVHPNGRINLQDLVKTGASAPAASASASASAPGASAAMAGASADAPIVHFGPTRFVNGQVSFSDHFIRPNYSADLTALNGSLGAFSTVAPLQTPQMASLQLAGRAQGTAQLAIGGQLNPLAQPLALDITAKVTDLELPPLSPYAVKYSGHGIERGKLSMDVAYKIAPDGQLTATNKLVLNQLQFGEQVPGAPASLPVTLATALLADSNGVIDLDLPISGSLNDPQFSLGPIIVKAIFNLIGKAITAPFSLLAHALGGGGGDDMSQVPFAPGSARLSPDDKAQLDKIAKALTDRPHIRLTVTGMARLGDEREGLRRERLKALVAAEQRADSGADAADSGSAAASAAQPASATSRAAASDAAPAASAPASAASGPAPAASDAEYARTLRRLYRRADIPGKPRNAIGMTRDVPVAQMEALLLAHIGVTGDDMRQLATRRAVAVKDYLLAQHLDADRIFIGAPRTDDAASDAASPASAAESASSPGTAASTPAAAARWTPHAELQLSAR